MCQYSDLTTCNGNGTANPDGTCTCWTYVSNYDGKTKTYLGNHCNYSDNTTCDKGYTPSGPISIGTVNPDGTCNYDCSKVMPRCLGCSNNTNLPPGKVGNITCSGGTPNPYDNNQNTYGALFGNCTPISTTQTSPSANYGCQINPDRTAWTPLVGASIHSGYEDWNYCIDGAVQSRIPSDSSDPNYCVNTDLTTIPSLKTLNTTGLASRGVSGVGAYNGICGSAGGSYACSYHVVGTTGTTMRGGDISIPGHPDHPTLASMMTANGDLEWRLEPAGGPSDKPFGQ
jgi:hypothetical protein